MIQNGRPGVPLFNSALETGVRSVVVLNAAHPRSFDLLHLTWFDHLVVHTNDVGGPASLHPDVPHRSGEIQVRRRLVEHGLTMMRRMHLVDALAQRHGILFQASDDASAFVGLMRSAYSRLLRDRAAWLAEHVCSLEAAAIGRLVYERVGRWDVEFQADKGPGLGVP